jgi:preprotein translocase subunit SecE
MSENERLDQTPEEELTAQDAAGSEPAQDAAGSESKPEKKSKEGKAADKKAKEKAKKKAKGNRLTRWLREMRSELKKVQWPTWKQVAKNTGIVILCVLVVGVFIWIFDALAHAIIQALMHLFS